MAMDERDYHREKQLKGSFNERKYHPSREWSVSKSKKFDWKKLNAFVRYRSGKNTPFSLLELILYGACIAAIAITLNLQLKPTLILSIITIYVLRQYKIRTYDRQQKR